MEEQLAGYKLKLCQLLQPDLIESESIDKDGIFEVNVIIGIVKQTGTWIFLLTNFRVVLAQFGAQEQLIIIHLNDLNSKNPISEKKLKNDQKDYSYYKLETTTNQATVTVGIKGSELQSFLKQMQKEKHPSTIQRYILYDEEIKAKILHSDHELQQSYSRYVIQSQESLMTNEDFWKLNENYQDKKGQKLVKCQKQEILNQEQLADFVDESLPIESPRVFSMNSLYQAQQVKETYLQKVELENDLVMNMENPEEAMIKFYRERPPKKRKDEKQKEERTQIQGYEYIKFMQQLDDQSNSKFIMEVANPNGIIEDLVNQPTLQKPTPTSDYRIVNETFDEQIQQNEGAEFFQEVQKKQIIAPTQNFAIQFKQPQKQNNNGMNGGQQLLKFINSEEIFARSKNINPKMIIAEVERTFSVSEKAKQKLEQREKEFFKISVKLYSDVRKLLQLFYLTKQQNDRKKLNLIADELRQETIKIRQQIEKDKSRSENEMKKNILEDLQKMIERALNQLI